MTHLLVGAVLAETAQALCWLLVLWGTLRGPHAICWLLIEWLELLVHSSLQV
jgi:hypothetical protein